MEKIVQNKRLLLLLILGLIFLKCQSYRNEISAKGDMNKAIMNCIIIYYNQNKKDIKKYEVFRINIHDTNKSDYYHLDILPSKDKISIRIEDSLGSIPKYFPTNYMYYKNKLFIWNDKSKILSNDILGVLHEEKILDSIWLKYDLGIYKDDWDNPNKYPSPPLISIDENIEGVDYIICKDKINTYTRVKSKKYIPYEDLPKPKCD